MNVVLLCSIYDSKAEAWLNPMCFQALGQAMRSFSDAVNSNEGDFSRHPEDYTLFHIGSFNVGSGELVVLEAPMVVCLGINVKEVLS